MNKQTRGFSHDFFSHFPKSGISRIQIVIPVRDEAGRIEKTLEAFRNQIDLQGKPFDLKEFEILFFANNCTDDTVQIIEKFQNAESGLKIHLAEACLSAENSNVGFVRRVLMDAAFERLARIPEGFILTTDGDTSVAEDWISANLREFENGADAVGGRIIIAPDELERMDRDCREIHLIDEEYRLLAAEIEDLIDPLPFDRAPRHHQHFNASFAVRASIYEKAGGIPDVKFLEDCAFFDRLQRIDARVRHSPDVRVFTSARRTGRSEVGLSFQINEWKKLAGAGEEFRVEPAEAIVRRISARGDLREIRREFFDENFLDRAMLEKTAEKLQITPASIRRELEKSETFGEFYENLLIEQNERGLWRQKYPSVAVSEALENLKNEIKKLRLRRSADFVSATSAAAVSGKNPFVAATPANSKTNADAARF